MCVLSDIGTNLVPWIKAAPEDKQKAGEACWQPIKEQLAQLEEYIKPHVQRGYIAGGKLSVADFLLYTAMATLLNLPVPVMQHVQREWSAIASVRLFFF